MQFARQLEPRLTTGYIAGAALGDLSKLKVQFLMVNQKMAKRRLTDAAGVEGIAVHAWTINDPALVGPLLDEGVSNIITDNAAAMRATPARRSRNSPPPSACCCVSATC